MSCIEIKDGTGGGKSAKVGSDNRLQVKAVSIPVSANIAEDNKQTYILASDFISLTTTGSFNALMYIKNTSTAMNLHIEVIRTCSDTAGTVQLRLLKNPTAGTIVNDENASDKVNSNFGSSNQFTGLSYSASGDGKTFTDGTQASQFINNSPGHSIQDYNGLLILGPGDALGITAKPSVALTICAEVQVYFTEIV